MRGAETKRIVDNKLDHLSEYGALNKMPIGDVQAVIEWMIDEHLILQTKSQYPVLHPTYEGMHYSESMTEGRLKRLLKYLEG